MRKSSFLSLFALAFLVFGSGALALAPQPFKDVPEDHWARGAIERGRQSGMWEGYAEGNFGLGKPIHREEIAVVLDRHDTQMKQALSDLQTQTNALRERVEKLEKQISSLEIEENTEPPLRSALKSGANLEKMSSPELTLPSDLHAGQIENNFHLGDLRFALVMQPSDNITLKDLPASFDPKFRGILVSDKDEKEWEKLLEIKDTYNLSSDSWGNNPYFLWKEGEKLFLSIVDEDGDRDKEGIEKVYSTTNAKSWTLEGCYYFGARENHEASADFKNVTDYYAHSKELSKLYKLSGDEAKACENDVELRVY